MARIDFLVDGKVFSLGDQLSFKDMAGKELVYIRQKVLDVGPTYEISRDGQLLATVHKELLPFSNAHSQSMPRLGRI